MKPGKEHNRLSLEDNVVFQMGNRWVSCCVNGKPKNGSRNVRKISQVIASAGYAANFSIKSASPAG
jgi:hypothetical protein